MAATPSLRVERSLLRRGARAVACVDEVGRGALAGPVMVGVVVVDASTPSAPRGIRDSKDLTAAARTRLAPRVQTWAVAAEVGSADAAEIDAMGILAALRLATHRAIAAISVPVDAVLLDGSHDWLGGPRHVCEAFAEAPPVIMRVKADRTCSGVAGASVVAKVRRDEFMVDLSAAVDDCYSWTANKGYSAPAHSAALIEHGPSRWHRRSWQLPGVPRSASVQSDRVPQDMQMSLAAVE